MVFAKYTLARHSQYPHNPFHVGYLFRGYAGSQLLRPARLLASPDGSDWCKRPATGGLPSRPEELHPEALTDPDLTLARHPARVTA